MRSGDPQAPQTLAAVDACLPRLVARGLGVAGQAALRRWAEEARYAPTRPLLDQAVGRLTSATDHVSAQAAADDLVDAFSGRLPIGTGGRRGPVGPGPNRMNAIVVRETVAALARLLQPAQARAVAIVYDTRRESRDLAWAAAGQLVAEGRSVLVVDEPRSTPLLSHMVRTRGLPAGIVITASHNPPGDNGIKVYGADGGQVIGALDEALAAAIAAIADGPLAAAPDADALTAHPRFRAIAGANLRHEVDDPYLRFVRAQGVALDTGRPRCGGVRVVFSPLHGVGEASVVPVLEAEGADVVAITQPPDGGAFATVASANPESPAALSIAAQAAERLGADLVLATDPDADRLGALARDADGALRFVDGNRLGVLMLDHLIESGVAMRGGLVVTTLVTTPMVGTMARAAGAHVVDDILVGFKHHAAIAAEHPDVPLIFACEESHGYLRGGDVRDKDGAIAALLLTEAVARLKAVGFTLWERLAQLWDHHGYHCERTANLIAPGARGRQAIASAMAAVRAATPRTLGGWQLVARDDRQSPRNTGSPTRDRTGDVVLLEYERDGERVRLVFRPSGTEPKLKVYALARGAPGVQTAADRRDVEVRVEALLEDARRWAAARMATSGEDARARRVEGG